MTPLRLFAVFFRIGAMNELAYRANFWFQLIESVVNLSAVLGLVAVVTARTESLAGWRPAELCAVVGVYFVVLGLINLVIAPSLSQFMEDVRMGTLDFTLTKPRDAQFLVSVSHVHVWKVIDVALGVAVLAGALFQLSTHVGPLDAAAFAVALLAGGAIVYSFWIMLATLAFWFIRIENLLMVFWMVYNAGRWPVTIYPTWLRLFLTVAAPIAFAVTIPVQALTQRLGVEQLGVAVVAAAASLWLSRTFWRVGLRHYAGASS